MPQQHPYACFSHNIDKFDLLIFLVAVDAALGTGRLFITKLTLFKPKL